MVEISVYAFSSKNITNIWAGYGAGMWAAAEPNSQSQVKGQITKALKMSVGSFGILYCDPWQAYTVPFVTASIPDKEKPETEIWEGKWVLPFRIIPLGSPRKRFDGKKIYSLPGAREKGIKTIAITSAFREIFRINVLKLIREIG